VKRKKGALMSALEKKIKGSIYQLMRTAEVKPYPL
jgi:hypothetical protein